MEQALKECPPSLGSDRELLEVFSKTRSQEAFREIVRRHAAAVYWTCHRIVGSIHDAEDAAQAVFLILARRPQAVTRTLAGWLHRVASRIAWRTVQSRVQRLRRERAGQKTEVIMPQEDSREASPWRERLDQALERLPDRLREAVVLRYLEGHPEREAARIADCPQGTLSWRAMEGLSRLRALLGKGGAPIGTGILLALLAKEAAGAAPSCFIAATVKSALVPATALVSAKVAALVEGGIKAMIYAKLKVAAAVVLSVSLAGAGTGVALFRTLEAQARTEDKDLPPPIPEEKFQTYFTMVKPYPGEFRWRDEITWAGTIHEARERASKEDKPILAWQSANSPCLGAT